MRCYTKAGTAKCHKTAFGDGALTADQKWKWGWLRCGVWPFARMRLKCIRPWGLRVRGHFLAGNGRAFICASVSIEPELGLLG